jgi:hypothetical protein
LGCGLSGRALAWVQSQVLGRKRFKVKSIFREIFHNLENAKDPVLETDLNLERIRQGIEMIL